MNLLKVVERRGTILMKFGLELAEPLKLGTHKLKCIGITANNSWVQ